MTREDFASLLAEGMHTAFRKATSCEQATLIHQSISQMPDGEWGRVVDWFVDSLFAYTGGNDLHVPARFE